MPCDCQGQILFRLKRFDVCRCRPSDACWLNGARRCDVHRFGNLLAIKNDFGLDKILNLHRPATTMSAKARHGAVFFQYLNPGPGIQDRVCVWDRPIGDLGCKAICLATDHGFAFILNLLIGTFSHIDAAGADVPDGDGMPSLSTHGGVTIVFFTPCDGDIVQRCGLGECPVGCKQSDEEEGANHDISVHEFSNG